MERSDSEAAVAKGLPPTNPDVRENVLLYRYDLKVSKKEPLRRLLISKGHFFLGTLFLLQFKVTIGKGLDRLTVDQEATLYHHNVKQDHQ